MIRIISLLFTILLLSACSNHRPKEKQKKQKEEILAVDILSSKISYSRTVKALASTKKTLLFGDSLELEQGPKTKQMDDAITFSDGYVTFNNSIPQKGYLVTDFSSLVESNSKVNDTLFFNSFTQMKNDTIELYQVPTRFKIDEQILDTTLIVATIRDSDMIWFKSPFVLTNKNIKLKPIEGLKDIESDAVTFVIDVITKK